MAVNSLFLSFNCRDEYVTLNRPRKKVLRAHPQLPSNLQGYLAALVKTSAREAQIMASLKKKAGPLARCGRPTGVGCRTSSSVGHGAEEHHMALLEPAGLFPVQSLGFTCGPYHQNTTPVAFSFVYNTKTCCWSDNTQLGL